MKVRAQFALIFNLDKCIGCHTCSVTCKNTWTSRKGVEYAWFNNVETKPGIGYPQNWEDQVQWSGGWARNKNGKLTLRQGGRLAELIRIFANPALPEIRDYYEPFTFDYAHLINAPESEATPTARPVSQVSGRIMEKIAWGPNWEDEQGGSFDQRSRDSNFRGIDARIYKGFKETFHFYLPRICNHCLNPACVAACPSAAIYKREEDGLVLVDQDRCRGWRFCISACPYKKVYFNWESGKSEKCIGCYPRVESGMPTICSETCVGKIRYNGIILYDADRISEAAVMEGEKDIYEKHLSMFLDPNDPEVIEQAVKDGIPNDWIDAAQRSPIYKIAVDWRLALPLHPEFRTLPMVWYVPPMSPIQSEIDQGSLPTQADGVLPDLSALRIPVRYLANLLTAGDEKPVRLALRRLLALRSYERMKAVEKRVDLKVLEEVGLSEEQAAEMYRYLAIAKYEDRFVVPTSHVENSLESAYAYQGENGFSFDNPKTGVSKASLFPKRRTGTAVENEEAVSGSSNMSSPSGAIFRKKPL
ncbi:respiratory nitrate reductase 2 beta chain [bacterium BMS3Abin12]|nr:respiratory nitrate reductase 2 beta chain [bacterium BMS3Abin12]GBE49439.1 respiratory nitrate reductase 2 beta chain [bacterium BMS3Bbin13]